jgi:hypothetical protein
VDGKLLPFRTDADDDADDLRPHQPGDLLAGSFNEVLNE